MTSLREVISTKPKSISSEVLTDVFARYFILFFKFNNEHLETKIKSHKIQIIPIKNENNKGEKKLTITIQSNEENNNNIRDLNEIFYNTFHKELVLKSNIYTFYNELSIPIKQQIKKENLRKKSKKDGELAPPLPVIEIVNKLTKDNTMTPSIVEFLQKNIDDYQDIMLFTELKDTREVLLLLVR